MQHTAHGVLVVLVVGLTVAEQIQHGAQHGIGLLGDSQPPEVYRRALHPCAAVVQLLQLLRDDRGGQKAVVAVAVKAPLCGQDAGNDIAAGNDIEDIAGAPVLFQAAVCRVVVVIILLQIGAVCRRQGRRGGKGIDKGVFLFQLRQHGGQTRRHKVGHTAAPAVTAHPELQGAQRLALCRRLNVSSYFFNQLPRRRHKADVGAARPCMKVAGPLGPVAGAAQERPDDGHLPAAAHQRFAGDGAAHGVRGVVQAVGIVEQLHLGKAQLCKGVPDMVGAADLALHPVALVALPCTIGGCRHAQGGQRQLVVVLRGRVVEQAVAVIVVVPQVGTAAVTAVPQGIVVVWHSPAD